MSLSLPGCTSHIVVPQAAEPEQAQAVVRHIDIAQYDHPPLQQDLVEETLLGPLSQHYLARELFLPSTGDNAQPGAAVHARYYQGTQSGPRPLVLVLPLWGTHTYPPEKIAEGLMRRERGGLHVLRLLGENYLFDWDRLAQAADPETFGLLAGSMTERMRVTVMDIRRLIDWASARPEVDTERIGLIGFSMSAVVGGLVVGIDPRVRSAVLVMGGAHLEQIIAHCDGPISEVRAAVLPRFGWSVSDYESQLDDIFDPVNPANFPSRTAPSRILMIDSLNDHCMPKTSRDAFWRALGEPRRISYRYNHRQSFLAMTPLGANIMRRQIYRHVEKTLLQ